MPTVTLVLANGRGFPAGSADHRYEMEVTLDAGGRLDPAAWYADPAPWPARRFRPGEPQLDGEVQLDEETGWSLHFRRPATPQDGSGGVGEVTEPVVHAGVLRPGEYVTLRTDRDEDYSYRVVSVA
jgi:hypothetical protein